MTITPFALPGLYLIEPKVFQDERGFFLESYRKDLLAAAGIHSEFVQDNHSRSVRGTIRGIHFQSHPGQDKLVRCTAGAILDVAVDLRSTSPTFGKWAGIELSAGNRRLLFIPAGFAHGFAVLEDAEVQYKCSEFYNPATESGIMWNDPEIGVEWGIAEPVLSVRDQTNPTFAQWRAARAKASPS